MSSSLSSSVKNSGGRIGTSFRRLVRSPHVDGTGGGGILNRRGESVASACVVRLACGIVPTISAVGGALDCPECKAVGGGVAGMSLSTCSLGGGTCSSICTGACAFFAGGGDSKITDAGGLGGPDGACDVARDASRSDLDS